MAKVTFEQVGVALLTLATAVAGKACGQSFPVDSLGHSYINADYLGIDSAHTEFLVKQFKQLALAEGQVTYACAFGRAVTAPDGGVGAEITSLTYEPTVNAQGPDCAPDAIGFIVLVPPQDWFMSKLLTTAAIGRVIATHPKMIFGAAFYGLYPVPPEKAAELRIPLQIPKLELTIYYRERSKVQGRT